MIPLPNCICISSFSVVQPGRNNMDNPNCKRVASILIVPAFAPGGGPIGSTCLEIRLEHVSVVEVGPEKVSVTMLTGQVIELNKAAALAFREQWYAYKRLLDGGKC
jgi:hypothetical protein